MVAAVPAPQVSQHNALAGGMVPSAAWVPPSRLTQLSFERRGPATSTNAGAGPQPLQLRLHRQRRACLEGRRSHRKGSVMLGFSSGGDGGVEILQQEVKSNQHCHPLSCPERFKFTPNISGEPANHVFPIVVCRLPRSQGSASGFAVMS